MNDYSQAVCALDSNPSGTEVTSLAALLLPSFGAVVFAVALLQVLFLSEGAQGLFRDSDTGWHIRNGEAILNSALVPRTDTFSYTRSGVQWFAWEWLSDVVVASAHRFAGLPGVALLAGIAIALTAWAAARLSLWLGGNLFFTAGSTVLLLGVTSIHWLARPHVFSWLLSLAFLGIAERERREGTRMLFLLPVLAGLWANLHGSFLLGPAILFIYAVASVARVRFAIASLATLLTTFVNPYGWHLHEHVLTYLQNEYLMDHIAEFRSFSFHAAGAYYVELFLIVCIVGILALLHQRAYPPAILAMAMLHMSLYSARHLPTAAVLLLPLCVAAMTREAESWPRLRGLLDYSERLRAIDVKVWGVAPIVLVLAVTIGATLSRADSIGFSPARFPIRAADFLAQRDPNGRVFSKDQWGGYLIYRFAGNRKVFIDGRSDFYGQSFLETYAEVADVKPGWNAVLNQYDIRFVLIPADHALASALSLRWDWKRVYTDTVAVVFEKKGN